MESVGGESGRSGHRARPVAPVLSAKHRGLARRGLSEPMGEFDRCLSIALDRMIDAIESEIEESR